MSGATRDEAALWRRARDGDPEAFGVVFDLHRDRVFTHALRLVPSWADAEDVTAAAFLELWRRRDRVRFAGGSVLPWLLVTATNLVRNNWRARRRHRAFLARLPRHDHAPDAADVALDESDLGLAPALLAALRDLPPADQALLTLVAVEDYPLVDAAAVLGLTAAAAKSRLHRIRHRVRDTLARHSVDLDYLGADP